MTSYLFRTTHVICLDPGQRPDLRDVTDWLERAIRLEGAEVKRDGERSLDFRPNVGALGSFRPSWEPTLAFVSRGEIEVDSTDAGPRITVYLQPRSWLALIPLIQISLVFGVAGASGVLRWGAGLGGLLLVGLIFGWAWVNAQDIFGRLAEEIRLSHAKIPPRRSGAANMRMKLTCRAATSVGKSLSCLWPPQHAAYARFARPPGRVRSMR